jgi:hypothetical protein
MATRNITHTSFSPSSNYFFLLLSSIAVEENFMENWKEAGMENCHQTNRNSNDNTGSLLVT